MDKNIQVYFFVQDNCQICEQLKKEFDLQTLSTITFQGIPIYKVYPTQNTIDKYNLKSVPTIVITSSDEIRPNIEIEEHQLIGFASKTILADLLHRIKNNENITSPIN